MNTLIRETILSEETKIIFGECENILFSVNHVYEISPNGNKTLIEKKYTKENNRRWIRKDRRYYRYDNDKAYRDAIKRWSKSAIRRRTTIY